MKFSPNIEKALFQAALEFTDRPARTAYLDEACRDQPELRERLEKLFAAHDASVGFFEQAGDKAGTEPVEETATRIGRYRLLHRLGEGGFGVVYIAEQLEPVVRRVALKIIRLGMNTEQVIARFELERRALALMDHPNIARVLDAGATASGRPFFVMEHVDGRRITEFCDEKKLPVRERLELFIRVCQAIQHAHQKGIIHRDIKPSNVLVCEHDGEAVPKVIDFGIAKATGNDSEDDECSFTGMGQFLGTPAYMSPEQADGRGLDVDTRSDVYSLGVLLYELLTGHQPFDPKALSRMGEEEIRRVLREVDPPSPSAALSAMGREEADAVSGRRACDVSRLRQVLRGDLDGIVMKAMEKDRRRRYDTANGLVMDLVRHLNDEPVSARVPSRGYRFFKLVRRNRAAFITGGVVVLALGAGFGVSTYLFFQEKEARMEQARLRMVSEKARANEEALRIRAEYRERASRAAVFIRYGDLEKADQLLASIPEEFTPSSLEAAGSYQTVAEWHLLAKRWKEAATSYAGVASAMTSIDPADSDNVSRHLLPVAAVICRWAEPESYERFRERIIVRFAETTHPVVAEQVLKACLLKPADAGMMRDLRPFAEIVTKTTTERDGPIAKDPNLLAWSWLSLALFEIRNGEFPKARESATRGLALNSGNEAYIACNHVLMGMIEIQTGSQDAGAVFLDLAAKSIDETISGKPFLGGTSRGFWHDWVNALILLEEARGMLREREN